jgi:hypothetical protein
MNILAVVSDPRDWPLDIAGVTVVSARAHVTDARYAAEPAARVFNLCKSYQYQTLGYYVSLLAEARGHKPLPRATTIEDMHSQYLVRHLAEGLNDAIQRALAPLRTGTCELSIYFGRHPARRYDALSAQLFNLLQAPLLPAQLERQGGRWHIRSVRPLAMSDVADAHRPLMIEAATAYFTGHNRRVRGRRGRCAAHDPGRGPARPPDPALHRPGRLARAPARDLPGAVRLPGRGALVHRPAMIARTQWLPHPMATTPRHADPP